MRQKQISLALEKRVYKITVQVLLNDNESWSIHPEEFKRLQKFDHSCFAKPLRCGSTIGHSRGENTETSSSCQWFAGPPNWTT